MTYFPMGTIDSSNFNSTKYAGVCKPTNQSTLDVVRGLQRQINRVLSAKKISLIAEDGDIGAGTVKALDQALGKSTGLTCMMLAVEADTFTESLRALANSLGAPAVVVAPKPPKPSTFIDPGTNLDVLAKPPGISAGLTDAFKNMSTTSLLIMGAAAVGAGYYLTRKPKGRGRR